jgi:hypothetical protein
MWLHMKEQTKQTQPHKDVAAKKNGVDISFGARADRTLCTEGASARAPLWSLAGMQPRQPPTPANWCSSFAANLRPAALSFLHSLIDQDSPPSPSESLAFLPASLAPEDAKGWQRALGQLARRNWSKRCLSHEAITFGIGPSLLVFLPSPMTRTMHCTVTERTSPNVGHSLISPARQLQTHEVPSMQGVSFPVTAGLEGVKSNRYW